MTTRKAPALAAIACAIATAVFVAQPRAAAPPATKSAGGAAQQAGVAGIAQITLRGPDSPGGFTRVRATLNRPPATGGAAVMPMSRLPQNARLEGDALVADVKLDVKQVLAEQKQYIAALGKSKRVTRFVGRQKVTEAAPRVAAAEPPGDGNEVTLEPFAGSTEVVDVPDDRLIKQSLMITDLKVVENPARAAGAGPWTFGHLVTAMANPNATGIDPSTFARQWIEHWRSAQTVNRLTVTTRPAQGDPAIDAIIGRWEKDSGVAAGGKLDLTKAPFRLLAIISRLDLRSNLVLGVERIGDGGAGEARFVFCAVDTSTQEALPFTVIFEYGIKKPNFDAVRAWATQWYELSDPNLELGSEAYNAKLEAITNQFTAAGADPESPPNRSALSQLRTNEIALAQPWEIREFRIDAHNTGYLRQVTVKQTPDLPFDNGAALSAYINATQTDILGQRHAVPVENPPGTPFLGGSALTPVNFHWKTPGLPANDARHLFSLATCNGCHAREAFIDFAGPDPAAAPTHFTHVAPRAAGEEAKLSAFLSGKDAGGNAFLLADPVQPAQSRAFADLERRANDLRDLVKFGTFFELSRLPLQMVH